MIPHTDTGLLLVDFYEALDIVLLVWPVQVLWAGQEDGNAEGIHGEGEEHVGGVYWVGELREERHGGVVQELEVNNNRKQQQSTTTVHNNSAQQQCTTTVHNNSAQQQYTTPVHNNSAQQQFTTTVHNNSIQQQFTTTVNPFIHGVSTLVVFHRGRGGQFDPTTLIPILTQNYTL